MAVSAASTCFILVCMGLVQLMTPGLAFFYAGLVPEKSALTMTMQSFVSMGIIGTFWYMVGFSLCFGESATFMGSPITYFGMKDVSMVEPLNEGMEIPGLLFAAYQGMFAVITPALMTGAFADRFRFLPYIIFLVIWLVLVYAPWCHWVWGGGFLAEWGVWDFAGGLVVHVTAGFSALAALVVVGKRPASDDIGVPHNVPFVALGTALLWFGWFGFNGGSALAIGGQAIGAAVNSDIAGGVALTAWIMIDWFRHGKPGVVGLCVGAIAGLATITPAAGFVQPWAAFIIGIVATFWCYGCVEVLNKAGLDDALDVWGVHGMGGFIGTILIGVLADPEECLGDAAPSWCIAPGTVARGGEQLMKQAVATLFCAAYSFVVTFCILFVLNKVMPLVPEEGSVREGLDFSMHGEVAYSKPAKIGIGGEVVQVKEAKPQSTPVQKFVPEDVENGKDADVENGKDAVYMPAVVPTTA